MTIALDQRYRRFRADQARQKPAIQYLFPYARNTPMGPSKPQPVKQDPRARGSNKPQIQLFQQRLIRSSGGPETVAKFKGSMGAMAAPAI